MGRTRKNVKQNENYVGSFRVVTTASSNDEKPCVLVYNMTFDFTGQSDEKEYEMFNDMLYHFFYKEYPQDKKIINIDIPEYDKSNFNKQKHHCKVEVYQLNTGNIPFDDFESIVLTDVFEMKPQIEALFREFGFRIEKSEKKVRKSLAI